MSLLAMLFHVILASSCPPTAIRIASVVHSGSIVSRCYVAHEVFRKVKRATANMTSVTTAVVNTQAAEGIQ